MSAGFIGAFLFVFVFLGAFVILVSMIPSGFLVVTKNYGDQDMPQSEAWSAIYLQASNSSYGITINHTDGQVDFSIGARNLRFFNRYSFGHYWFTLAHRYGLGLEWQENMDWYNEAHYNHGSQINEYALDDDYDEYGRLTSILQCEGLGGFWGVGYSSRFNVQAQLSFNETAYSSPSDAWLNDDLYLAFGIDFDQSNTSINAWDMIARLLLFQKVDVFGSGTEANQMDMIMSFTLWGTIAVLALIVIIELIPF